MTNDKTTLAYIFEHEAPPEKVLTMQSEQHMTSQYAVFANHNADAIATRARAARASGDGMGWGKESHTLDEAAADMGAIVLGSHDDGALICELSDRLYVLGMDDGGPWAVEVATQDDLVDEDDDSDVSDDDIRQLQVEAGFAGDTEQVDLCEQALEGDNVARVECVRVIRDMRTDD